jgi:RNA-directed DNA polymerase
LALHLGCNVDELQQLAESAKSFYKPFELIPKLRPFAKKPPKKPRPIDNPTGKLKKIQERINKTLLEPILLPEHVFGAVKHRSIIGNAQRHQGACARHAGYSTVFSKRHQCAHLQRVG